MKLTLTLPELKYAYYDRNLSTKEIARENKCGSTTVVRLITKYGLKKNKKQIFEKVNQTRKETFRRKYGTDHYMQSKTGFARYASLLKKHHGVSCIFLDKKIAQKRRKTHLARYGCLYSSQNRDCQEKRKNTLNTKYGGNYKKHLSLICAEKHINNPTQRHEITTKLGHFIVRSKLEKNIIEILSKFVKNMKYEPFVINTTNFAIIPDLLLEGSIIIEIKYYKYAINTRPNIVHKKHFAMWQSAYRKIPELRIWCKQNKYKFLIMTERGIKKYSSFDNLITYLQTTRPNNPSFGHY